MEAQKANQSSSSYKINKKFTMKSIGISGHVAKTSFLCYEKKKLSRVWLSVNYLPNPGIKLRFPTLLVGSLPSEPQGKLKSQKLLLFCWQTPLPPCCFCALYKLSYFSDNNGGALSSSYLSENPLQYSLWTTGTSTPASWLWMIVFNMKHCPTILSFILSPNMVDALSACHGHV